MSGFEVGETALKRFVGPSSGERRRFAAAERTRDLFRGGGELLARGVVERAEGLKLRFELAERGAKFFETVGHMVIRK